MASEAERDAERLKDTFNNLTESIRKSAEQSGKIRQTFLDLSSTANASGQAWTVVSRLTSGTGFWRIQNRVRAISNFFNFQEKRQKEFVENEKKQIEYIKEQITERDRLAEASRVLLAVQENKANTAEREAFYLSDQFTYLSRIFGRESAILKMKEKIANAQKNINKAIGINEELRGSKLLQQMKDEVGTLDLLLGSISGTQYDRMKNLSEEQRTLFAQVYDNHATYRQSLKEIKQSQKEYDDKEVEYLAKKAELDAADAESDKIILREEVKEMRAELELLNERGVGLKERAEEAKKQRDKANKELTDEGVGVSLATPEARLATDRDKPITESLMEFVRKNAMFKLINGYYKSIKGINYGQIFRSAGLFFKGFLTVVPLLFGALLLLKQTGILDLAIDFFKAIGIYFYELVLAIMDLGVSIGTFISRAVDFIMALLTGSSKESFDAFSALAYSFFDILKIFFWDLITVQLLGGLVQIIGDTFSRIYTDIKEADVEGKFNMFLKGVGSGASLYAGFKTFSMVTAKTGNPYVGAAAGIFTALGGKKILDAGVDAVLGGKADGGPINKSGTYLVGERGPELVSLARGQYVTPNEKLGGTVNIYVNGRVGASETELRDIGNRLGDIINNRGNRVGNTRIFR